MQNVSDETITERKKVECVVFVYKSRLDALNHRDAYKKLAEKFGYDAQIKEEIFKHSGLKAGQ